MIYDPPKDYGRYADILCVCGFYLSRARMRGGMECKYEKNV